MVKKLFLIHVKLKLRLMISKKKRKKKGNINNIVLDWYDK